MMTLVVPCCVFYSVSLVRSSYPSAAFSCYFLNGCSFTIPTAFQGYMCDWMGATHTVQGGAIVNVIGSMLTPYISREAGPIGVIIIRFLMGCGQGVLVPCMSVLIAYWFPLSEKSTAVAIATTGNQVLFRCM